MLRTGHRGEITEGAALVRGPVQESRLLGCHIEIERKIRLWFSGANRQLPDILLVGSDRRAARALQVRGQ